MRVVDPEAGHGGHVLGDVGTEQLQGDGHELMVMVVKAADQGPSVASDVEGAGSDGAGDAGARAVADDVKLERVSDEGGAVRRCRPLRHGRGCVIRSKNIYTHN